MDDLPKTVIMIKDLAVLAGVSVPTLNRLKRAGKLPHHKIGSRVVFTPSDVELFFTQSEVKPKEEE
ncbi:MAG: helix-turn-helix domain-containing protein [Spirochaetia bacterium]|nr:helix-turn-helix domain-containing protein [Spirochaetia bacterium]